MNTAKTVNLYANSVLVYITASVWSARRLDKRATKQLNEQAQADPTAANVSKHLLATADKQLKAIHACVQKARRAVVDNSLPWDDAGNRIVSNAQCLKLVGEFAQVKRDFMQLVDEFIEAYPTLREEAMTALGDMADPEDYPPAEELRYKFALRMTMSPVADSFLSEKRNELTGEQSQIFEEHYKAAMRGNQGRALEEAWSRLREHVKNLRARLEPDDKGTYSRLRDSTVDNLRETCRALKSMNVFGDPALDSMCDEVYRELAVTDAKALRNSSDAAMRTAARADAIVAKLQGFM